MVCFLDLDGTCCDATERFQKAGPEPKERGPAYSKWLQKVQNELTLIQDKPVTGMKELASCMAYWHFTKLVYLTGRSEIYRDVTEKWLKTNHFPFPIAPLLMRPKRNRQGNGLLKEHIINQYLKDCDYEREPVIVIDDDYNGDIEAACHRNGWTFLKARSGGVWK